MKSLKDIFIRAKKFNTTVGDVCLGDLVAKGYIYNDTFGWEKLETLKRFNLDPQMKGVPCYKAEVIERKEVKKQIKDTFGKNTGDYKIDYQEIQTGNKTLMPTQDWMNYQRWKKDELRKELAKYSDMEEIIISLGL